MKTIKAKPISYGAKRDKKNVKFIVIHYTGVKGDTAVGEASYFAHGNTRTAGAHFFVDRQGTVVKSIPMNFTAWSVGGKKYANTKGGTCYGICKNSNSVSIELCDIVDKQPSDKQIKATANLVRYIKKNCPNVRYIIRHYDVTGKPCPASMLSSAAWMKFKNKIS